MPELALRFPKIPHPHYHKFDMIASVGVQTDFPGEPRNQVPRKSLISSEILIRHPAFLCERKLFSVKGNNFLFKK